MLRAPVELVLGALEMARAGRFAEICEPFAPPLRPLVSPEALAAGWNAELARQGPVTSVGAPLTEPTGTGVVVVKVAVSCEHGGFALVAPVTEATSMCRTRWRRSSCCVLIPRSTRRGSSCSATAWAARSPRRSPRPSGPSPA